MRNGQLLKVRAEIFFFKYCVLIIKLLIRVECWCLVAVV